VECSDLIDARKPPKKPPSLEGEEEDRKNGAVNDC
jgi:hypothetical protein